MSAELALLEFELAAVINDNLLGARFSPKAKQALKTSFDELCQFESDLWRVPFLMGLHQQPPPVGEEKKAPSLSSLAFFRGSDIYDQNLVKEIFGFIKQSGIGWSTVFLHMRATLGRVPITELTLRTRQLIARFGVNGRIDFPQFCNYMLDQVVNRPRLCMETFASLGYTSALEGVPNRQHIIKRSREELYGELQAAIQQDNSRLQEEATSKRKLSAPPPPALQQLRVGDFLDVKCNVDRRWHTANVENISPAHVRVHFSGWPTRWDEVCSNYRCSSLLRQHAAVFAVDPT
jgi:hypothetical protein